MVHMQTAECTEQDAAITSLVLLAYIVNHPPELMRYYDWLIETGALEGPDIPDYAGYGGHLEATLNFFLANYHNLLPTGKHQAATNARMTSGVAPRPGRAPLPGKEGSRQGTDTRPTGRRDGTCLHPVR